MRSRCFGEKLQNRDCLICRESLISGGNSKNTLVPCILPCGHSFHVECISGWISNDGDSCPLCREHFKEHKSIKRQGWLQSLKKALEVQFFNPPNIVKEQAELDIPVPEELPSNILTGFSE